MDSYLKVFTVESERGTRVVWEVRAARSYFKDREGNEVRMKAPNGRVIAYQGYVQHCNEPLSSETLEQVCRLHLSGSTATYRIDLRWLDR